MFCNIIRNKNKITGMSIEGVEEPSSTFGVLLSTGNPVNALSIYSDLQSESTNEWYGNGLKTSQSEIAIAAENPNGLYIKNDKDEVKHLVTESKTFDYEEPIVYYSIRDNYWTEDNPESRNIRNYTPPKFLGYMGAQKMALKIYEKFKTDPEMKDEMSLLWTIGHNLTDDLNVMTYTSPEGLLRKDGRFSNLGSLVHVTAGGGAYFTTGINMFQNPLSEDLKEAREATITFIHEIVHLFTIDAYKTDSQFKYKIDRLYAQALAAWKMKEFHENIEGIRELKQPYGLTNALEFMAEAFSNKEFQQFLVSIKDKDGTVYGNEQITQPGLWDSFVKLIMGVLQRLSVNLTEYQKSEIRGQANVLQNTLVTIINKSSQKQYFIGDAAMRERSKRSGYHLHLDKPFNQSDFADLPDSELNTPQTPLDTFLDRVGKNKQKEVNRQRKINSLAERKQKQLSLSIRKDTTSGKYLKEDGTFYKSITHHEMGLLSDFDPNKEIRQKAGRLRANSYEEAIQLKADELFAGKEADYKRDLGSLGVLTKAGYIAEKIKNYNSGKEKGTIVMKQIEMLFSQNEQDKQRLQLEIDRLFMNPDSKWFRRNKHFDWIKPVVAALPTRWNVGGEDKIELEQEITSPTLGVSGRADIIVTRENGLLVIRDIKTNNGLKDIHSNAFMLYGNQNNRQIMDTEFNKAKFQVVWYAFMKMVENPGTKFESLGIDWMPYESFAIDETISDITLNRGDISAFLGMIQDYYKDNKEDAEKQAVWAKIKDRTDIFDSVNYSQVMEYVNEGKSKKPSLSYNSQDEEFKIRLQRLKENTLFNGNLKDYQKLSYKNDTLKSKFDTIKEDVERLTEMLSGGEVKGASLSSYAEDLTTLNYYLGTLANTGNPVVEIFHKLFNARMNAYRTQMVQDEQNFRALQLPVVNERRKAKGLPPLNNERDIKRYISSINALELYGHLYKEYRDEEGNLKRGLFRSEEDLNNPANNLTLADKKLLSFLNAHYDSFFVNKAGNMALLNRPVTYTLDHYGDEQYLSALDVYNGKAYTKKGQQQRNWNYDDQTYTSEQAKLTQVRNVGWMPKVAPTEDELLNMYDLTEVTYDENGIPKIKKAFHEYSISELKNRKGPQKFFSAAYWKNWYKTRLTDFWDNEYSEAGAEEDGGIPLRGLGGKIVSQNLSYSLDIEAQFMGFTSQMRKKEHLDEVYALGKGLSFYLNEYNTPLGKDMKNYLSDFLDAHVRDKIQELPNKKGDFTFWTKITQFRSLRLDPMRKDGKYTYYNLSVKKLLRYMKRGATGAIMFLSPVSSFINMMQAYTASVRKGLAFSAAEKFHLIGTDKLRSITDFSVGTYHAALGEATKVITSTLRGKNINDEKAWILSREMGFLPDNMEYQNSHSLFSGSWKVANPSHGYLLQGIPEEINSLAIMIAQMKSQIIKSDNPKYNGKSMWDIYEVKEVDRTLADGQVIKVKIAAVPDDFIRGYEVNESGEKVAVRGLTNNDKNKMKRVYERIQGGYRTEERTILETTLLGELFIQFRKFVPSILRDQFGSQKEDYSLGYYENKKVLDGNGTPEEIMEWKKRVIEGRFKVIGRMLLGTITLGKAGFMVPSNVKSGLNASSTMQNRWRWSDMNPEQQLMVIDTLTILALWASPALVIFKAKKSDDDDDSYLKLLQRISNDIIQPLDIINSFTLLTSPEPVGAKVLRKRLAAYTQLAFDALLYVSGNEQDIYTQKGNIKGMKDALRYTPGITSSLYKGYDFITHKKNDFADIVLGGSVR